MSDTSHLAAPPPSPPEPAHSPVVNEARERARARRAARWLKLKIAFGLEPEPGGRPSFIWLERWDAFIIAFCVAVGVPLLGFSGFSWSTKLLIAWIWSATFATFYAVFEGRELVGQMIGRGAIEPEQLSAQQQTAQDPFYGIYIAVFVWLLSYVAHVIIKVFPFYDTTDVWHFVFLVVPHQIYRSWWESWISYRTVEWGLIVEVWLSIKYINYVFYNTGNILSKAAPMGERVERLAH